MNSNTIIMGLIILLVILLLVYIFIISKFNHFINDHRRKVEQHILKQSQIYHKDNDIDDSIQDNE